LTAICKETPSIARLSPEVFDQLVNLQDRLGLRNRGPTYPSLRLRRWISA